MKKEEEELPECNLWVWIILSEGRLFKVVRKEINTRFRWDEKTSCVWPRGHLPGNTGWLTPLAFALVHNRQSLIGRLLKNGADVNAPCMGFDGKSHTLRPIELLHFATKSEFLVLRRSPSIDFCVAGTNTPFYLRENLPESTRKYIWQKRMNALCFCFKHMGQSWPDIGWILKDLLHD